MPEKIAVIVPCHNEEVAIATVIQDFRRVLPSAEIYVYDNLSTDRTAEVARAAGAIVRSEPRKGKGNVVRRMFADVDADVYLMVDGDATYHAESAPGMIDALVTEHLDMVVAVRKSSAQEAYRSGHEFGNRLFNGILKTLFGSHFEDIFSGYRAFSRRFVKSFPAASSGFEIETELSLHSLELSMPVQEIESPYGARPKGPPASSAHIVTDHSSSGASSFSTRKSARSSFSWRLLSFSRFSRSCSHIR